MNEEQIREIVERTAAAEADWDDWDAAIAEEISEVLGEGARDVVRGVVEEVNQHPDRERPIIGDDEDVLEVIHRWLREAQDEFLRAITQAIMARLQRAGFLQVPR